MTRLKTALVLTVVVVSLGIAGAPASAKDKDRKNGPRPQSYVLPGNAVFPEGVAFQQSTGAFYVSSTTDGTIFRGNVREAQASVFLPGGADGRATAVGLKVDRAGQLFIAGGGAGRIFVYDTATRALRASFSTSTAGEQTFINDVAVTRSGAYFTDSVRPFLFRVFTNTNGALSYERFIDFTGTPLQYQQGFNLNGIAASANGKYLVVVQSNTGKLFRIDIASKQVTQIDLGGQTLTNGDGLLIEGHTLYVVRNQQALIVKVRLSGDFSSGRVVSSTNAPSLRYPTTIAFARGRLLVVNSQFDKRAPGLTPELPFTVSSIKAP
jgi:Cu-Zn family superoxide dismutase